MFLFFIGVQQSSVFDAIEFHCNNYQSNMDAIAGLNILHWTQNIMCVYETAPKLVNKNRLQINGK